jgi:phage baseplate assembly protein W
VIFYFTVFIKNNHDIIFIDMANGITYGLTFPFRDSFDGKYLDLSDFSEQETRSNLIHLLLSRKGSRYYLPDFGTRLYEYLFEPLDGPTFSEIESEIRESVSVYLPGITITNISITSASDGEEDKGSYINEDDERVFRVPNITDKEHTAKVKIDYNINNDVFNSSDFVIINI